MLRTGVALINAIPFNTGSVALNIKLKAATAKMVYKIICISLVYAQSKLLLVPMGIDARETVSHCMNSLTQYERLELNVQSMGMSHPVYLARKASSERMSEALDTDAECKYTSLAMYTDPHQQSAQDRSRDCKTHTWTWYNPEELRIIGSQVLWGALYDLVMEAVFIVVTTSKMIRDHWQETVAKLDEVMKQCEEKQAVDAYNELVKRATDSVEAMEMHLAHSIAALTHGNHRKGETRETKNPVHRGVQVG
ncbi:hypothetical protein DFJ73DRAFT_761929 [Zopfochytrium polystomum]|nr:hypothetical protein DFJ73DRAFT_761929 [Zopfochytrium polystomum]